jgi:hypothetical protein
MRRAPRRHAPCRVRGIHTLEWNLRHLLESRDFETKVTTLVTPLVSGQVTTLVTFLGVVTPLVSGKVITLVTFLGVVTTLVSRKVNTLVTFFGVVTP